ncbi:MAG: FAD-dependent oxidoreductase [Planctomycetaceae bacterium]
MVYDIAVIGNDEAAFEMLLAAAGSGLKTVAVIPESRHSSWLVGQALQRLIADLLVDRTTERRRLFAEAGTPRLLQKLISGAVVDETAEHIQTLDRLGIDVLLGEARFLSADRASVSEGIRCGRSMLQAKHFVIGTGVRHTAMHRPLGLVPFLRPESLFEGARLPDSLCLLGGDVFGAGLAALFSLFGVEARHVARDDRNAVMLDLAQAAGVAVAFHPSEFGLSGTGSLCAIDHADVVDCRRTVGFTEHLGLSQIGVEPDENGQLWCGGNLETWCRNVFGVGDVIGFSPDFLSSAASQAQRVLKQIRCAVPRPHLRDVFVHATVST